jgi:hypothetical protein
MRFPTGFLALLLPILVATNPGRIPAAPITFSTALPVAKGEYVSRVQCVRAPSGNDPSGLNRGLTEQSLVGVLGYGATGRLALFGALPFVHKDLELDSAGRRVNRSASGVGDLRLFGRYTLLQRDAIGRTSRVAPLLGVKLPSGSDEKSDSLGRLPPSVQPGSGSVDLFGALVVTHQTLDYQLDAQLAYRDNNEANKFRAGDELRADGSFQYRLWPGELGPGVPGFLYGVVEANLIHRWKNKVGGSQDPNSGGTTLLLSPGVQYVTKRWIVEGVVQVPVVQDLNGDALEADYVARFGVRVNF